MPKRRCLPLHRALAVFEIVLSVYGLDQMMEPDIHKEVDDDKVQVAAFLIGAGHCDFPCC